MADETEQQLREEIASQKISLARLPTLRSIIDETGLTSPETKARAQLIKELSDNEEQLELLIESKRVAAVVCLQDELHPPVDSGDCPICLETIKHVNYRTISRLFCCGGFICRQCSDLKIDTKKMLIKCPLCRENIPHSYDYEEIRSMVLGHSNKGKAWAQTQIGMWYLGEESGSNFFAFDEEKGLQFLKQAADQRDSDALLEMALAYSEKTLKWDESKYMYYLKEAADLGHPGAQRELGLAYESSNDENTRRLHYITLAASQGDAVACYTLGAYFMCAECGLTKSLILAKHYSEKSLEEDEESKDLVPFSACNFSCALLDLDEVRYEGVMEIPGHSPIPKALFWARKSLELANDSFPMRDNAIHVISDCEEAKRHCANCMKENECASFKRCVRCLGAWYCGKECQVQHWKAGHKIDCIKRK